MSVKKNIDITQIISVSFYIGLDGTLSGGMNEIAHIEELAWGLFYYNKIGSSLSTITTKVKTADVPVCTTLFLDEAILDKLFFQKSMDFNSINSQLVPTDISSLKLFFQALCLISAQCQNLANQAK